ncbi:alpha/beta hydrolase [uncultured Microbacterium sp.]|uniref:alpha/beta hydrolase n=1 Tax=uncultured Microbacterium sp. TaxID=191216 RepID=UPI002599A7A2|nr:alpha/beta hydrolase [uncultured Microbacterium sp.]
MSPASADERTFTDATGIRIFYDVYTPERTPRAAVYVLHGVGEHARRYRAMIGDLVEAGYLVYADDHRGHGRTGMEQHGGDASKLGRLGRGGMQAAKAACWQLTELIRDENPDLPLIILGHSWGSFLTQMLVDEHADAYDAVILSGSSLRWPGSMNAGDLNKPWNGPGANGLEWLASDQKVVDDFIADPLTTSESLQKLFGPVNSLQLLGRPARDLAADVPVLLMVGRDDTVGGPHAVHRLADAYRTRSGLTDVATLVYPDVRHEIFNDVTRDQVIADLLAWLDPRFPARG